MPSTLRFALAFAIVGVALNLPVEAARLHVLDQAAGAEAGGNRFVRLLTLDTATGAITNITDVTGPLRGGGIDFDSGNSLYLFGTEWWTPSNPRPHLALYRIDMGSGLATQLGVPFPDATIEQDAEAFAIIGDTGYTVRHESRSQGAFAQLYAIDLERGMATRIGDGYPIPAGAMSHKTTGLASDGASLYSLRANGRIDRLDPATGRIVATIVSEAQASETFGGHLGGLAFGDDALWLVDTTAPAGKLYRIDPDTGARTVALDNIPNDSLNNVTALASSERNQYASLAGALLFATTPRLGVTLAGDVYAKRSTASGSAHIQLGHAKAIKSLRCAVGDNQRRGHVTASVKRTSITAQATNEPSETVVSVSTEGRDAVANPIFLRSVPAATVARVDNRRYGYSLHVEFVGARSFVALNPAMTPSLYFRGCVIETR